MALMNCPAPGCDAEVVDNWLTCPKCRCPIQVLRAGQASRAPPEPEGDPEQAELEHLQELSTIPPEGAEDWEDSLPPEPAPGPETPEGRLQLLAQGALYAGVGFALGVPLLLGDPAMASFCGVAALTLMGAGALIQRLTTRPGSGG